MVVREYDYIKGSTATNPSRNPKVKRDYKEYKKLQKANRNKNLQIKNRKKNDRRYVLTLAIVIFSFGCSTILGDSKVYTMQKQVSDINTQIRQIQEENEALKVKLIKYSSLDNIQQKAEANIGMGLAGKNDAIKVDFSDNYFKDVNVDNASAKKKETLFSKLMSLIK